MALAGASGAGKTTLLQILGGLDRCTSGSVEVEGRDLSTMKPRELARYRGRRIGFVFQFHHLLPDFTALENVIMPGMVVGRGKPSCLGRGAELLEAVGLDRRSSHFPAELSGGERQRVALARALFNEPVLVLADEPTGNLDSRNSSHLLSLMKELNRELSQTFLIATHNEHLSSELDRTIFLEDGRTSSKS